MKLPTQFLFESNTNQKWTEVYPCGLIISKSHVISGLDAFNSLVRTIWRLGAHETAYTVSSLSQIQTQKWTEVNPCGLIISNGHDISGLMH